MKSQFQPAAVRAAAQHRNGGLRLRREGRGRPLSGSGPRATDDFGARLPEVDQIRDGPVDLETYPA